MNSIQKMMLDKVAAQFKEQGITKVIINWELSPDDKKFFEPVGKNQILVHEETHVFLKTFYKENQHLATLTNNPKQGFEKP